MMTRKVILALISKPLVTKVIVALSFGLLVRTVYCYLIKEKPSEEPKVIPMLYDATISRNIFISFHYF